MNKDNNKMEEIVSLCKRRGFIFQGSEIYGGLAGTWDYGPYGVLLKENIKRAWIDRFVYGKFKMYQMDAAILMNPRAWEASGHVSGFSDPLVSCKKCKKRFRADHVDGDKCPECGGYLGEEKQFNMMFKTAIGASEDESAITYLRPETAGGMFVNFKNIVDSIHPKLPFGLAQIGKAFRNEIAPRDFIFRSREFEQMEIEFFVEEDEWEKYFEEFRIQMNEWINKDLRIEESEYSELDVPKDELAHYSKKTIDFEFEYPFGRAELYGLAYRTDFDLKSHGGASGQDLMIEDSENKKTVPHVIEPSFGMDRTVLAVLITHFMKDEMGEGGRVFLKLPVNLAPVKIAVFPLLKNKPELVEKAREIFDELRGEFKAVEFDDNGNVGKRYRRQDEIGTPFCVTVDFDTLEKDNRVTVRDRDTGSQERIEIEKLKEFFQTKFS